MNRLGWKVSPAIVAGLTAALVVIAPFAIRIALNARATTVDPRVTLDSARPLTAVGLTTAARPPEVVSVMDGEVSRTADRIGEATALALASSLYAATEQIKGRAPRSVQDLLSGLAARNLLPPGLAITQSEGTLSSTYGSISVRYRPMPLGIEVVALGREPADGPALMVRVPDEAAEKGEARLYIANRLNGVSIPAPFAPAAEVIASGWSPERLRSIK
ncbi:MAG: hypothetical protein HONDAALG_02564 [Gammaproteobacteria bacterium]|nr:hypothetical protein [Gammaproteobacteria bacterium]